jgi:tRNA threonylcarbamoyl adenosine modification protein YjeE
MKEKIIKTYKKYISTIEDSEVLAEELISCNPRVICLTGNLGAGKTTLAGMIIKKLTKDPSLNVKSPTFNIMQIYDTREGEIHHYDLYRLKNLDEALEIGIEESFENAISIIEWPEIILPILPKSNVMMVNIEMENDNRVATIEKSYIVI